MPCHLSTYGTQNKDCTCLDGTTKGESAHVGSFPIIFSKSVVFAKFLCVDTLSIFSPLTAALHVLVLILNFILLHCGSLGAFGLSFYFTKNIGNWKAMQQQEAAEASKSRIQNKHIKNFIRESCSNFLQVTVRFRHTLCYPGTLKAKAKNLQNKRPRVSSNMLHLTGFSLVFETRSLAAHYCTVMHSTANIREQTCKLCLISVFIRVFKMVPVHSSIAYLMLTRRWFHESHPLVIPTMGRNLLEVAFGREQQRLYRPVFYCTVLCGGVLYYIVLSGIVLYSLILDLTDPSCAVLVLYSIVLYYTALPCTLPYYIVLYSTVPLCSVLCCTVLCCTIRYRTLLYGKVS